MIEWTNEKPSVPGHYWLWQESGHYPCQGRVQCVMVEPSDAHLRAYGELMYWVPYMDFADPVGTSDQGFLWAGPITAMAPPGGESCRESPPAMVFKGCVDFDKLPPPVKDGEFYVSVCGGEAYISAGGRWVPWK